LGRRKAGINPKRATPDAVKKMDRISGEVGLLRPTLSAPVLDIRGELEVMRWGFQRSFSNAVVNAREDKLEGGMWKEAMETKRCLIPVSAYFEWSGPRGNKRTHRFTHVEEEWLWVAGIWEDHPELGKCFSMITTHPTGVVRGVHDRMPAVLSADEVDGFLNGSIWNFQPADGLLEVRDAVNPLTGKTPGPVQQELF